MTRRLIVVTGSPRSGTTPVGDALAAAPGVRTLYEPLNFHVGDRRVQRYFEVPGTGGFDDATLDDIVTDVRRLRLQLRPGVFPEDRGLRRLAKSVIGSRTRMTYRQCRLDPRLRTIVWKDPFAAFFAAELAGRHGIPVVATIRPPAAVAASFKRLGWGFDVADIIGRLHAQGHDYTALLDAAEPSTPVGNAAVLWVLVNDRLLQAYRSTDGIVLLDLERFVEDRRGVLQDLYVRLDLAWTPAVERHLDSTQGGDAAPARETRAHVGNRDPAAVNHYWIDILDEQEARLVENVTGALWRQLQDEA